MNRLNIRVENMTSTNGNDVVNQFIIYTSEGQYFQSYNSVIAFIPKMGKIQLDENKWDYSKTTGKYRNIYLCETKKQTQDKIDRGVYELVNLNK